MAIAQGFGKTTHNNLIFGFDTGDMDNSYRGAPGQNYAGGPFRNYSGLSIQNFDNGKVFRSNGYKETVFIPTLGYREVDAIEIHNEYDGYGTNGNYNCCPNIYSYTTGGWNQFPWLPNTTYTYQIIYKSETGYTHPNYMYHYEYRANGSYITEYGVHTEGLRTHLGDGWYHAWNTFTTHPEAAIGYCGMWHYEYYGRNKVSLAAVSIVPGTIVRPPRQFIDEGTTRSSTQGLLDLASNRTINISTASFTSTGVLTFDGTDDFANIGNLGNISDFTVEIIFKSNSVSNYRNPIDCNWLVFNGGNSGYSNIGPRLEQNSSGNLGWVVGDASGNYTGINVVSSGLSGAPHHYTAITRSGSSFITYYNGTQSGSTTFNNWFGSFSNVTIGRGFSTSGERWFSGQVPVVKIYNRRLSSSEITQNYNHYRTRFGI